MGESIFDLGFETINLEISFEEREGLLHNYSDRPNIMMETIVHLEKSHICYKVLRIYSSDPKILTQINETIKVLRVNYIPRWREKEKSKVDWKELFFHFLLCMEPANYHHALLLFPEQFSRK